MLRTTFLLAAIVATTACTSRIELPGTVIAPQVEAAAVEGMGPPEQWRSVDASTGQIADLGELEELAEDFPDSASVRLRLLGAQYRAEDAEAVAGSTEWLVDRDYLLATGTRGALSGFLNNNLPARSIDLDAASQQTIQSLSSAAVGSELASLTPNSVRLPEASLWDAAERRMLVTTVVSRTLFVSGEGQWNEVPLEGAGSLAGIALDAPRGLIWVGSGVVDQTPDPGSAFRGVIAIDRGTLEERRRVPAPQGASISDIAVGPDGTVYGSDPVGGGVYSAGPEDEVMQTFIAPGTFRSPQGVAVRPDNSALYISDYRYGIAQVMLRSRAVYRMRAAEPMLLDGVDGLWLHGNQLIAMQNGVQPFRLTAFELGQGIGVIASHRTLEFANPDWTEPLGGAITGDCLYYVATGQWDIYGEGGVVNEGKIPTGAQIRRVQLVETPPEQP